MTAAVVGLGFVVARGSGASLARATIQANCVLIVAQVVATAKNLMEGDWS